MMTWQIWPDINLKLSGKLAAPDAQLQVGQNLKKKDAFFWSKICFSFRASALSIPTFVSSCLESFTLIFLFVPFKNFFDFQWLKNGLRHWKWKKLLKGEKQSIYFTDIACKENSWSQTITLSFLQALLAEQHLPVCRFSVVCCVR